MTATLFIHVDTVSNQYDDTTINEIKSDDEVSDEYLLLDVIVHININLRW